MLALALEHHVPALVQRRARARDLGLTHCPFPLWHAIDVFVYCCLSSDKEIASDAFDQKPVDGYKGVREIQSKKILFQEVEADIGANASKGDGEADEDGDEGAEASEAQTVINVVHAAHLQKMDLSAKEFSSLMKAYWKKLIEALNKDRYRALGIKVTEDDDKDSIKHVYNAHEWRRV
jgi:hypothetical protein